MRGCVVSRIRFQQTAVVVLVRVLARSSWGFSDLMTRWAFGILYRSISYSTRYRFLHSRSSGGVCRMTSETNEANACRSHRCPFGWRPLEKKQKLEPGGDSTCAGWRPGALAPPRQSSMFSSVRPFETLLAPQTSRWPGSPWPDPMTRLRCGTSQQDGDEQNKPRPVPCLRYRFNAHHRQGARTPNPK